MFVLDKFKWQWKLFPIFKIVKLIVVLNLFIGYYFKQTYNIYYNIKIYFISIKKTFANVNYIYLYKYQQLCVLH